MFLYLQTRYIPDISRALLVVMTKIKAKQDKLLLTNKSNKRKSITTSSTSSPIVPKRGSIGETKLKLLENLSDGSLSEAILAAKLNQAVDR